MASMGPSFPPHPAAGIPQHPGAPAHPMGAPGMAHNPSQPGAPPQGIPHQLAPHMAVSAPGGQMNPGPLVGGMPPSGGGPSAHAMSHLNPAQAQIFQAQHNNMGACEFRPVTRRFAYLQPANIPLSRSQQPSHAADATSATTAATTATAACAAAHATSIHTGWHGGDAHGCRDKHELIEPGGTATGGTARRNASSSTKPASSSKPPSRGWSMDRLDRLLALRSRC